MNKQSKESVSDRTDKQFQHSAEAIENFVRYLSSPWRIVWTNFVAGIFRGLGAIIGATVVIAAMIWLLSLFVKVPLVGKYAERIESKVIEYADETNYNQELDRLGDSLERIESALSEVSIVSAPDQKQTVNSGSGVVTVPAAQPDQSQ